MPDKTTKKPENLGKWLTSLLRLTAFTSPSAPPAVPGWWQDLVGEPPASTQARPREAELTEEGPFKEGRLTITARPTRIDWIFTPREEAEQEGEEAPTVGPFPQALEAFCTTMLCWLPKCPPIQRLAFGGVLTQPTESRVEGYRMLSKYLHAVKIDPEGSSDFSYRINRPRRSRLGINDLQINRIAKWSVLNFQRVRLEMTPGTPVQPRAFSTFSAKHYCALELDLSTPQDLQTDIPKERVPDVFKELVDLGVEIAVKGDVP